MKEFFGKEPNLQLHPDEAICQGATTYAAILSGDIAVNDMTFQDVIPITLGTDIVSSVPEEAEQDIMVV